MAKNRTVPTKNVKDTGAIANEIYNEAAGAQKQMEVGPKLVPIPTASGATTVANSAAVALPSAGRALAIYNNSASVACVAFGDVNVTATTPGTVDANGFVSIPCAPNTWTHLSAGDATHVKTSAATLLVFLVEDNSTLVQQKR